MKQTNKTSTEETVAQGIRAIMCDRIKSEFDRLITEQVDPWMFFNSKGISVKKFNGKQISISGAAFSGSVPLVFWNDYIQPFIQDIIKRMIVETIEQAAKKDVPLSLVLESTKANLAGGIDAVFAKMQDIDQRLRGKGNPKSVSRYDTFPEICRMNAYLDRQVETYRNFAFEPSQSRFRKWYDKSPHIKWLIGIIISVLALVISAGAVVFSILSRK